MRTHGNNNTCRHGLSPCRDIAQERILVFSSVQVDAALYVSEMTTALLRVE